MTPRVTVEELQRLVEVTVFARDYGFTVESVGDGVCTLRVPFQPGLERPGGVIGGPAFMAAADAATWLAILTRLGPDDTSVTAQLGTIFLAAARREDFLCTAEVVKLGRRLIYAVAECVGTGGRRLTHHTVIYARPDPPPAEAGTD